jgi:hypothetical protein
MTITVHTRFNSRTNLEKHHRVNKLELVEISRARPLIWTQSNILARLTRVLGLKPKMGWSPARLRLLAIWTVHPRWTAGSQYRRNKSAGLPRHQTLAISPHPAAPERVGRPAGTR